MRQRGAGDVSGVGRHGICLQLWRGKFSENADFADREVGNVDRRTRGYEMNVSDSCKCPVLINSALNRR